MFLDPDDAASKRCPFVPRSLDLSGKINGDCISNYCMMWRWRGGKDFEGNDGYCGLAGSPEA